MSILISKYNWEYELEWYRDTLAASSGDWKVVVVHYPAYTAGNNGPDNTKMHEAFVAAAEQFGVDIFLAGHDHNLQVTELAENSF